MIHPLMHHNSLSWQLDAYLIFTGVVAISMIGLLIWSAIDYFDDRSVGNSLVRTSARRTLAIFFGIFLSPIWPVALVIGLAYGVSIIIRDALKPANS